MLIDSEYDWYKIPCIADVVEDVISSKFAY